MNRPGLFAPFIALTVSFLVLGNSKAGYDPTIGRWLSRDALDNAELRQGTNLYSYVGNNSVNVTDPLGLYYLLIPGTWFDGRGYEGTGAEFFRGADFDQGAYAGLDGLNPFGDPFATHGFYDPCDRTLQRSRAIGEVGWDLETTLAAGGLLRAYGAMLAADNPGLLAGLNPVSQYLTIRGTIPVFFWNSGIAGQFSAIGVTGGAGYLLYQKGARVYHNGQVIFGK